MADTTFTAGQEFLASDLDDITREINEYRQNVLDLDSTFMTLTGTAAPTSTPTRVGQIFVDKTANKGYIATGIANSSDWTILN